MRVATQCPLKMMDTPLTTWSFTRPSIKILRGLVGWFQHFVVGGHNLASFPSSLFLSLGGGKVSAQE